MSANKNASVGIVKYGIKIINIGLIFLSLLAIIKSIFVSFDIDEAYAIAQSYRLVIGDRMFSEMWEPHQMSAFGSAIFMVPFLWITGGDTTGIVLYLRIMGTLIHFGIGYGYYKAAQKRFGVTLGILISLVHVNFLPKWITLPEFEIMQYWAVSVLFLALLAWLEKPQNRYLFLAGTALFVAIMTYPTMLLLYPFYLVALWVLGKGNRKEKCLWSVWFTLPELILGIGFLIYLFAYMSVEEFIKYVSYVFMDESHSVSLAVRMAGFGGELLMFAQRLGIGVLIGAAITFLLAGARYVWSQKKQRIYVKEWKEWVVLFSLLTVGTFLLEQIFVPLFGEENQFYLYFRFLVVVLTGLVGVVLYKSENKVYLWLGIFPGFLGVVASILVTNMTLEVAMARIYIGVMATCFILCAVLRDKLTSSMVTRVAGYFMIVCFIGGLLVCKLLLVRVTGCIPISIKMHMAPVTEGPAAGLLLKEELAAQYNATVPLMEEYVQEEDTLLYFGCEHLNYMITQAVPATPSVQGTTVFDEVFLKYYEEHPERLPNVVVIDKSFFTNPHYRYAEKNQVVLDWIMVEFAEAEVVEMEYFTILRKSN